MARVKATDGPQPGVEGRSGARTARAVALRARADFTLDCWVMQPYGYEPGQRYQRCCIHGGPHTQYGHNFFDEFQVYAAAGYAVIYTNPRGSQGYGEAFTGCAR